MLISRKKLSSSPCFLFNQRLAHKELLQEAKQARSRAETMGAAGWWVFFYEKHIQDGFHLSQQKLILLLIIIKKQILKNVPHGGIRERSKLIYDWCYTLELSWQLLDVITYNTYRVLFFVTLLTGSCTSCSVFGVHSLSEFYKNT